MEIEYLPVFYILLAILLVYLFIIARLTHGWMKLKHSGISGVHPSTMVSIIIPARNEEAVIGQCLAGLLAQKFPGKMMEILVVDDHSEDRTLEILRDLSGKANKTRITINRCCQRVHNHGKVGQSASCYLLE